MITKQLGESLLCTSNGIEAKFSKFREERGTVYAELIIAKTEPPDPGLLHHSRMNLLSGQTKNGVVRSLVERVPDVPWADLLEGMCFRALEWYRTGEPMERLTDVPPDEQPRWLLYPYLEHGGHTVLFADGASGKSVLALAMAYSIATGDCMVGQLHAKPVPVAYLDWETNKQTHADRLRALAGPRFGPDKLDIWYRRVYSSLEETAPAISEQLDKRGIGAVVVDSAGLASRGSLNDPDSANGLFRAINSFRRPCLILHHISKSELSDKGKAYGTVYFHNNPRNTWSLLSAKNEGDPSRLGVCLTHQKSNNGVYAAKHAYTLTFRNAHEGTPRERLIGIQIERTGLEAYERFTATLSVRERILMELKEGKMSAQELAERIETTAGNASKELSRLRRDGRVINFPDRTWALAVQ